MGFTPISQTHLISPIKGTEVCYGNMKMVLCGVQARICWADPVQQKDCESNCPIPERRPQYA